MLDSCLFLFGSILAFSLTTAADTGFLLLKILLATGSKHLDTWITQFQDNCGWTFIILQPKLDCPDSVFP
jgi:hypothetical protein